MSTEKKEFPVIRIQELETVLTEEFYHCLACKIKGLGRSRLRSAAWLNEQLSAYKGRVEDASGAEIRTHPDIVETAYGKDISFSWNSEVKRFADTYPKQSPQARIALRLMLWDAAFKIAGDPVTVED